eukprot:CAMPEP_0194317342 /NCGR_PEP_ID=MMETSP0171-20130528/14086_1 /TAXON_ID=218684 /ORGANISM="Corethron pennatum, Strain L29A3" /LENGTH=171 /DNA_ID=CAMNT_0039073885 /DNA_START=287 /DNA_END=802 /DNA_ORIENTATION=+
MNNLVDLASTEVEIVVYVAPLPLQEATPVTASIGLQEVTPIRQEAVKETMPPPQLQPPSSLVNYQPVLRNKFVSLLADNEEMAEMRRSIKQLKNLEQLGIQNEVDNVVEGSRGLSVYTSLVGCLLGIASISPRTNSIRGLSACLPWLLLSIPPLAESKSGWVLLGHLFLCH